MTTTPTWACLSSLSIYLSISHDDEFVYLAMFQLSREGPNYVLKKRRECKFIQPGFSTSITTKNVLRNVFDGGDERGDTGLNYYDYV